MSLTISSGQAAAMALAGEENTPLVTWQDQTSRSGTTITSNRGTETDGALANAASGSTADFWIPTTTANTSVNFLINRSAAFPVNFIGIAAHTLADLGTTLTPEYSTDGGSTWTGLGVSASPTTAENIGFYFEAVTAADWRLRITGYTAGDFVAVGVISFARAFQFPQRMVYGGFAPPLEPTSVELVSNVTEGSNYIKSAVARRGIALGPVQMTHLTPDFVRGNGSAFPAFRRAFNNGEPFFFAWRPTDYEDLAYCWRAGGEIVPTTMGLRSYMQFAMNMDAYDDKS